MSLGLLGEYGSGQSGSEISDSDEEPVHLGLSGENASESVSLSGTGPAVVASSEAADSSCNPTVLAGNGSHAVSSSTADPLNQGVGDCDTDSDSSDSGSEYEENSTSGSRAPAVSLPLPDLDALLGSSHHGNPARETSVFSNPYRAAEEAKLAVLKRHVELTEISDKPKERRRRKHAPQSHSQPTGHRGALFDDQGSEGKRKHRGGVGDGLAPTKKFMKLHQHLQAQERPWTVGPAKKL